MEARVCPHGEEVARLPPARHSPFLPGKGPCREGVLWGHAHGPVGGRLGGGARGRECTRVTLRTPKDVLQATINNDNL